MSRASRRVPVLVLWAVALLIVRPAHAGDAPTHEVQLNATLEVSAAGDGKVRVDMVFQDELFAAMKVHSPDPRKFLQDLAPDRATYEVADASARYDDATRSVVMEMTQRAAAKNLGGGRWELDPDEKDATLLSTGAGGARPEVRLKVKGDWGEGVAYEGVYLVTLPAGATDAKWDERRRVVTWRLETPAGEGLPHLSAELRARDRVMSTIYKVYGLGTDLPGFWLAKTVFRNEGKGVARNLRARYRLQGYGEWSPWEKFPEVVPGQTVVSVHYPVLDASIARLKSNTPANLLLEYTYEDAQGKRHEDDDSRKVVLLGVNEFVFGNLTGDQSFGTWQEAFNNAPLLAAWVSRNDGAVKQFAAMANRMAGGVGAGSSDEDALKVLRACYELLQANDFTYQHPPTLRDRTVSFDARDVQNVKFPRETMRDRSGTCIDLAILFAAMVNAVGLEPVLALVPGHCFPLVKLPSGAIVGVETTGVRGGLRTGSAPFDRMLPYGNKELADAKADGRIYFIEVRSLWTSGIANPETEDLPPDILERWGISEEGKRGGRPSGAPTAPTAAGASLDAVLGLWGGAISHEVDGGTLESFVVGIDKTADGYDAATRADVTITEGGKKVVVITTYKGRAKDDAVLFESTERKRTVDGGAPELLAKTLMRVQPKGDHIVARVGNDADGYTDFTLVKKTEEAAVPGPEEKVRGSWGGEMPHAKLAENVILDELHVDVSASGAWTAEVRMEFTVLVGEKSMPTTVLASYTGGRVEGGSVRFEKVPWRRTVKETGQKNDLDGNPLVLRVGEDGRLAGTFEGDDGWPFTLVRREATPAVAPAPETSDLRDLVSAWGGAFNDTKLNDQLLLREATLVLARASDGGWSATLDATFVVQTPNGDVLVNAQGPYPAGRLEGDVIKFPAVKLTRTIVSSGEQNEIDGNPLEVRRDTDGRIEAKFVGAGGFTLTMARKD